MGKYFILMCLMWFVIFIIAWYFRIPTDLFPLIALFTGIWAGEKDMEDN